MSTFASIKNATCGVYCQVSNITLQAGFIKSDTSFLFCYFVVVAILTPQSPYHDSTKYQPIRNVF